MISVCKPIEAVGKIIEKSKIRQDTEYRLSDQCVMQSVDDGVLLYHTLTCELILLDNEEFALVKRLPEIIPEQLNILALKRFLVPADSDEIIYCNQLRNVLALTNKKDDAITSYTIFTTTDCNARCFYCYEMGRSRIHMSEATAQAAAEYISSHCKGKPVRLNWFGGEPLFNASVIDTIVKNLKDKGITYISEMISNGYLFDNDTVKKAKDEWKLKHIQITLDGTEEIYNKRKAYIYKEGSAYKRVLTNIGLLLDAGIKVDIRLNLDMNNYEDLHKLIGELSETFTSANKPTIYNNIIYEQPGENRSYKEKNKLQQMSNSLTDYINRTGLGRQDGIPNFFRQNQCMADDNAAVTITPEGRLGRCEHFSETEEMFGDIWSDKRDSVIIESWKERYPSIRECKTCFYYPRCFRLKKCSTQREYCETGNREMLKKLLQLQMLNTYKRYKSKEQDN